MNSIFSFLCSYVCVRGRHSFCSNFSVLFCHRSIDKILQSKLILRYTPDYYQLDAFPFVRLICKDCVSNGFRV
ncbi:unnamed protein product [Cuscuta campestris]|uniref:Uncharacterized protein n=1 Tax=Cuscuta campestris TaxID=132261 RepID=A0A484KA59_9ASTE|nr:unnamed protein product [Cuscuta campestris]